MAIVRHRNCKRRVDGIMEKVRDPELSPLMLRSDSQTLVIEIEDVRAERDECLKRIGDVIDAWDERSMGEPQPQDFVHVMEQLRDCLPFPWPEAKTW